MEELLHIRKLLEGKVICEQHQSEEIKMYCQQCKVAVCVECFIESHYTHQCLDIKKCRMSLATHRRCQSCGR